MIIKRYIVNNMNEAMTRIRYELGKDAVIISQRKIRKSGFAGFFSKKVIEVTAAVENESKELKSDDLKNSLETISKLMGNDAKSKISEDRGINRASSSEVERSVAHKEIKLEDKLMKEMKEMKEMINAIQSSSNNINSNNPKDQLQELLLNCDIDRDIVEDVLIEAKEIESDIDDLTKVRKIVESKISISKEKMEGTVVLVGPTGVGKTTTIAKLAGRLALLDKKKVGLITIDTYRIGAVEQLRTYADIMNIPFKVVITTRDMEVAIESMKDCDVILIDTTGRSSRNTMQLSELRAFVDKANTSNIHLVISCTTKNKDINSIVEGYKTLGYNNVIITKLDETSTYGSILNILNSTKKPLSFVTVGQNVPDDMKQLDAVQISNLILGEDSVC